MPKHSDQQTISEPVRMPASDQRDKPLERYLSVLELLAPQAEGLTAGELERALDLPKATMNRIIHVLLDSGLIASSSRARAYQLGPRILRLLTGSHDLSWLERITERPLLDLAEATGQSAFVARLFGSEVRSVNCVAPDTTVRFHIVPGTGMPPHASATAKSILAFAPADVLDAALAVGLVAFTPRTITDRARLAEELALVRARGYSVEHGEHVLGLASVARPIPGVQGEVRFAVGLTGPEGRIVGEQLEHNLAALATARDQLARVLSLPMP